MAEKTKAKGKTKKLDPPKTPKATGRPTKYEERFCQIARLGVRAGMTENQIAGEIGVSESTLNLWKKDHPTFSESLKSARLPLIDQVEKSHFRSALGFKYKAQKPMTRFVGNGMQEIEIVDYQEYQPPSVTAQIHLLKKNRPEKYGDKLGEDGERLIAALDKVLAGVKGELQS